MDGGGRLAGSMSDTAPSRPPASGPVNAVARRRRADRRGSDGVRSETAATRGYTRWLDRVTGRVARLPRHTGTAAAILVIAASAAYGTVRGGHLAAVTDVGKDVRDM